MSKKVINWLAGAVIMAVVVWLYLLSNPRPPPIDRRLHNRVGEVLAAEAIKLLEPGARLIVIARAKEPFKVPAAAAQLDAFLGAIKNSGRNVSSTRLLKVDPLRVVSVPPGDFFDLMRQAGTNDVIVSFLGPPLLSDDQAGKLSGKQPRLLALCSGAMPVQVDLKRIFERQLLVTAVISRTNAPAQCGTGGAQECFDQMFKVITPANVSELPPFTVRP
ncbi:MAG TPA: hypothetical protein VK615_07890 [Candidatus Binatia bacterium]|nr:hypothetical protein [Candidatus Binatia bacterium]